VKCAKPQGVTIIQLVAETSRSLENIQARYEPEDPCPVDQAHAESPRRGSEFYSAMHKLISPYASACEQRFSPAERG